MFRAASRLMLLSFVFGLVVFGQAPTGIVTGTVTDESGAVIQNASVVIVQKETGTNRALTANAEGLFSAPALQPGQYEVRVEAPGFRTMVRDAQVQAGTTTTVDIRMQVGVNQEVVNVEAATAQVSYDSNAIQGVVNRQTIQELPLNGRNFLQLATLEPGVTATPGPAAQFNSQFYIGVNSGLGGVGTLLTVDGGNINDQMEGGSSMNFSQEVVQEFQLSSVNFDLSTGITSVGAINIVTRSGTNEFHGSAYFYYRDHNIAAYPALARSTLNPNPFFARRNPGFWVGGPIKKDKLFFFFNLEKMFQTTVYTQQQDLRSLQPASGIFPSPFRFTELTARFDYRLSDKHTLFARYSHDGNFTFGPYRGVRPEPSFWNFNNNWADQSIMGLTSILTTSLVNDFRFQYHYWQNNVTDATAAQCVSPCVGAGLFSIESLVGSSTFAAGVTDNSPQFRQARSFEFIDSLSWQKGSHRIRFGIDYEHMKTKVVPWDVCDPGCLSLYSPETTRSLGGALVAQYLPNLPTTISSNADLLNLPVQFNPTSIYVGFPVGNGTFPGFYQHDKGGVNQRIHPYAVDTWKVTSNFTLNYGLAYDLETGIFYSNLNLPQYLAPIVGANNLGATQPNKLNFSPSIGFTYALGKSKKTVIRGGAGLYWDTDDIYRHFREGGAIGPLGDGRTTLSAGAFTNIFPNIVNLSTGNPIPVGAPLPISTLTNLTLGQFQQIYQQQFPALQARFSPTPPKDGPYSVTGLDVAKTGIEIFQHKNPLPRSYQTSIGVQRELPFDMVITVDYARRQFENVQLGELDLNRFNRIINGVQTPVIPICTQSQLFVPGQECSSGAITFWQPQGRTVYNGLLVKLQKRYSHHMQFTASYAMQKDLSIPTVVNLDNYFASYGEILPRHNFNFAGVVFLPFGFELGVNNSILSRTPVTPIIAGIDLNGAGNTNFPITEAVPGLKYNCFNVGCGKSDLTKAVAYFNATYAGKKDARGVTVPTLTLPTDYQFGDPTFDQDVRLSKNFTFKEKFRLSVFGEAFNVLNIANLNGYSYVLNVPASFGKPTGRVGQVFGSGGPRAMQVGARFSF